MVFQGQTMQLKCIKIADKLKWIVLQNTDLMYQLSVQPKLIAIVQCRYRTDTQEYDYFNPKHGYGLYLPLDYQGLTHVSTGVHQLKYSGDIDIVEPYVMNGFITHSISTVDKTINFKVYDYNHKLSDNLYFGFRIYYISKINTYTNIDTESSTNN